MAQGIRVAFVTGSAGFIGFHMARRLLDDGFRVIGLDALTPYYDPALKEKRNEILKQSKNYRFVHADLQDNASLQNILRVERPEIVVHLAAQAGVRYSLEAPESYIATNVAGTAALLEALRNAPPAHLLLASTSSVYGANPDLPYRETDTSDWPVSLYAATKKSAEALSHSYAHLFGIPTTALRFFTVYGPWGRPDMALFKFVRAMLEGQPIDVFNHGKMRRDFTYIDDLVETMRRLVDLPPPPPSGRGAPVPGDSLSPAGPYRVVNIGNARPIALGAFIAAIERALGIAAVQNRMDMQPGDVRETWADTALVRQLCGYAPRTDIDTGVRAFVDWYKAQVPHAGSA